MEFCGAGSITDLVKGVLRLILTPSAKSTSLARPNFNMKFVLFLCIHPTASKGKALKEEWISYICHEVLNVSFLCSKQSHV